MTSTTQCGSQVDTTRKEEKDSVGLLNPRRLVARIGKTNSLILSVFLGIALLLPGQLLNSLAFTVTSLLAISPFLFLSIAVAAYLKAAGADKIIARVFSGSPVMVIILASVFGALSPFCSCGVIPLIAALLASGVPLSAVMAFWISSPVMSPDMFVLTAGELGIEFAVAKTLATIGVGLLGGFSTHLLLKVGRFEAPLKFDRSTSCGASQTTLNGQTNWRFWHQKDRVVQFKKEAVKMALFLSQWLTFAFVLESLMIRYLPPDVIAQVLDPQHWMAIPMAALVGVPAYLNGYAAIPVASGLLNSGFSPGAVLTFMTAGAMTSIPAAIAVFSLVRRSVFIWYLFLSLGGSILMGFAYQFYGTF